MLKTYRPPVTFVVTPTRPSLALSLAKPPSDKQHYHHNQQQQAAMSADATVAKRSQQAMLASQRAKDQQASGSQDPRTQRGAPTYFPLGYREAVYQWWNISTAAAAERNVLSFVPFLKDAAATATPEAASAESEIVKTDPFGPRVWRASMVQLSGKNRALHELCIERTGEGEGAAAAAAADDTLVMLHGYGAGLGFFYRNFEPLSRVPGWRLYALDMLGMGNSSRPAFKIHAKDPKEKIKEAENWFIDALEEWRLARKIDKFTLLGHSLGGYLAVSYALKYPGHLNKLILASPVGVPEDPYAVNAAMPEPGESALANEFTQDQESVVNGSTVRDENGFLNQAASSGSSSKSTSASASAGGAAAAAAAAAPKRPLPGWLVWLWDANVSPFSLVRLTGPLGPRFVSGWTSRRFNHLPPVEAQALHTYAYSLFRQRGSGEYALPYILAPGAYARSPVINKIAGVGRQVLPQPPAQPQPATSDASPTSTSTQTPAPTTAVVRETGIPVVMMYGENDWMDVAGGYAAEEKLKQAVVRALLHGTAEEKRRENGSAKVIIVRSAGHHLYLDNSDEFNEYMRKEMEETRAQTLRRKKMEEP